MIKSVGIQQGNNVSIFEIGSSLMKGTEKTDIVCKKIICGKDTVRITFSNKETLTFFGYSFSVWEK
jgi:hypothetical protein